MSSRILLILLSVGFASLVIFCFAEKRNRVSSKTKAVYLPEFMFWIGLASGVVFLVIAWLASVQDNSFALTVFFAAFVLASILLMLGWKNCLIRYDNTGFTQQNIIGMQRSFTYDQVTAWHPNKQTPMESAFYANGKKISFNLMSKNGADFLVTVSAGYRKTHSNKNMPELSGLKKDRGGFRAHVYNSGEYLAIFIMLVVFIVGLCLWIVIDCLTPINSNDYPPAYFSFTGWEINEDSLVLTSPQTRELFYIPGYETHLSGFDRLTAKCNGNTTFSVCSRRCTPDDAAPYFQVYALSDNTYVYYTFEDAAAHKRKDIPITVGIFGGFLGIVLLFSGFIYIVGSHPQKFPKWVVYCCFKRDAIDF